MNRSSKANSASCQSLLFPGTSAVSSRIVHGTFPSPRRVSGRNRLKMMGFIREEGAGVLAWLSHVTSSRRNLLVDPEVLLDFSYAREKVVNFFCKPGITAPNSSNRSTRR
jgi:hypothetical protein